MPWILTLTGENEPWKLIGRNDTEAETSVLGSPDPKSWLSGKVDDEWWLHILCKCQCFPSSMNSVVIFTVTWNLEYSPFLLLKKSVVVSRTQPPRSSPHPQLSRDFFLLILIHKESFSYRGWSVRQTEKVMEGHIQYKIRKDVIFFLDSHLFSLFVFLLLGETTVMMRLTWRQTEASGLLPDQQS